MSAIVFFVCLVGLVRGLPAREGFFIDDGDTAIVESTVREVRAAVPEKIHDLVHADTEKAFLHTFGDLDGDDNERGYHKRSEDEGAKGYKHFDSFHKKDGDKYGYETHSAYGKSDHDGQQAQGHSGKYRDDDEGTDKEEFNEAQEDDGEETKNTYKVVEDVDEDVDGQYVEGEDGGHSGSYTDDSGNYYTEGGDSYENKGDTGHYTEGEEVGNGNVGHYSEGEEDDGNYGSEGSSGHYTDGSSGYTYGSDDGAEEKEDGGGESEHYTAADEDDSEDY